MKIRSKLQVLRGPMDMTPLIDVVFLLLIFFMLSSSFILQPGLKVELAQSLYGTGVATNQYIVTVMLEPERKDPASGLPLPRAPFIFFNDQLMSLEKLAGSFKTLHGNRNGGSVIIKADKSASQGLVIEIMNLAMKEGFSVVLATERNHAEGR